MPPTALVPPGMETATTALALSPGVLSHGHVFVTGMTGSDASGAMPDTAEAQFHNAFDKIAAVLAEAGLDMRAVVEMTSYHIGLRQHFDLFNAVRRRYLADPFPAWTAVEVAGLRREGALVEIRAIAATPDTPC
ncbi:MAG: RidA family protein [Rhodobacter sp.]|uniref:RidA family protein n=1 Tax=Pararhodobacter sp. TaxID=2127056 RepID=UPI001E0641EC|nr:RidA family protein [Pararhodobacter sp.]MCB1344629.1 RidA family protein [Paracoccaceae bacterium]MCC0073287.1 RidA family protein [Rhodobacter sp.]HPD92661.1 RidA family protein [Pararhodobacter sp.]